MDDFPNSMIFSSSRGKKSFNIDIPERTKCLESLFNDVLSHCELYRQISELIWGKI